MPWYIWFAIVAAPVYGYVVVIAVCCWIGNKRRERMDEWIDQVEVTMHRGQHVNR